MKVKNMLAAALSAICSEYARKYVRKGFSFSKKTYICHNQYIGPMVPRPCYSEPETRVLDLRPEDAFLQGSSYNRDGNELFYPDSPEDTF